MLPLLRSRHGAATSVLTAAMVLVLLTSAANATPRDDTREKLREVLTVAGARSDVKAEFRQSKKNPYNFIASIDNGLTYSDSLEVVVSATNANTIGFRVYPHYRGGYINIGRAQDPTGLMRKLLWFSDQNFFFSGVDNEGDVFSGYTITLESGFPEEAVIVVVRAIRYTDKVVGELRPFLGAS